MRNFILVIASIIILQGCGGGKKNNPSPSPKKAVLTSPAQNAICTTGTIISNTESSILFTWNASPNTNSYDLVLKNLLTSASTTQNTTSTQLTVTLARNTPYLWYIVSKSTLNGATAESDKWKFSGGRIVLLDDDFARRFESAHRQIREDIQQTDAALRAWREAIGP